MENEFMTAEELAKKINLSKLYVYEKARRNEIPHYKFGNCVRFKTEEIQQWIKENKIS